MTRRLKSAWIAVVMLLASTAHAEQFHAYDRWQIHYIAINTTFLTPAIAAAYGITRGADRGLVNVSILEDGKSVARPIEGTFRNLLGQTTLLKFTPVTEDNAVYYLASYRFQDREALRFELVVTFPCEVDAARRSARCVRDEEGRYVHLETVRFQQTLHVDD